MFGQGAHKEEDAVLREIIRSVDKKLDYTVRDVEGSRFNLHLSLKGHEAAVSLTLDDLTAAITDVVKRHQIRQKIKARRDHMDDSRFDKDVLGTKPARLLRASPKPESLSQRGFGRGPRR